MGARFGRQKRETNTVPSKYFEVIYDKADLLTPDVIKEEDFKYHDWAEDNTFRGTARVAMVFVGTHDDYTLELNKYIMVDGKAKVGVKIHDTLYDREHLLVPDENSGDRLLIRADGIKFLNQWSNGIAAFENLVHIVLEADRLMCVVHKFEK
jgi:hypothetical protein